MEGLLADEFQKDLGSDGIGKMIEADGVAAAAATGGLLLLLVHFRFWYAEAGCRSVDTRERKRGIVVTTCYY